MKKMSIFALLLAAVVMTSYSVSGTYAKYTSTSTGTDSARVAQWSFKVGPTEIATTNTFDFDLFETTYTNVESANGDKIIAPGTEGSFDIVLTNNSEVNATYTIAYTADTGNIPVEFSLGEDEEGNTTWYSDITALNATDVEIAMNGGGDTVTVYWRWAFVGGQSSNFTGTQTDQTDTALGTAGTDTIEVQAVVTATQVD